AVAVAPQISCDDRVLLSQGWGDHVPHQVRLRDPVKEKQRWAVSATPSVDRGAGHGDVEFLEIVIHQLSAPAGRCQGGSSLPRGRRAIDDGRTRLAASRAREGLIIARPMSFRGSRRFTSRKFGAASKEVDMTRLLEGKVAIIYGGGGGIGSGVARSFACEGARVCLVGRTRE